MMEKILEIRKNGKVFFDDWDDSFLLYSICGCNEPSRDYASTWTWAPENDDRAHIYISTELNKEQVLKEITPLLEKSKNCDGLKSAFQGLLGQ